MVRRGVQVMAQITRSKRKFGARRYCVQAGNNGLIWQFNQFNAFSRRFVFSRVGKNNVAYAKRRVRVFRKYRLVVGEGQFTRIEPKAITKLNENVSIMDVAGSTAFGF